MQESMQRQEEMEARLEIQVHRATIKRLARGIVSSCWMRTLRIHRRENFGRKCECRSYGVGTLDEGTTHMSEKLMVHMLTTCDLYILLVNAFIYATF